MSNNNNLDVPALGDANIGKGINVLMNNVTIAGNTGGGATGLYISGDSPTVTETTQNFITVRANNSIIWGDGTTIFDTFGRATYRYSLARGLTLITPPNEGSGASTNYTGPWSTTGNRNHDPANWSSNPLAGDYKLDSDNAGDLIDGGNVPDYPATASDLLSGSNLTTGTSINLTTFTGILDDALSALSYDATAAIGDHKHTTIPPATAGDIYDVKVTSTPVSGTPTGRKKGTAPNFTIDVGAYTK
jgi:hypothetical protein